MAEEVKTEEKEGVEKAIASAVGAFLTVLVALNVMDIPIASVEAISTGVAALSVPLLTWLTANTKKKEKKDA